jgi:DNA-binding transcriptional LysR family regulator
VPVNLQDARERLVAVLDPRQLQCFVAVAEEGNLSRAAARLHIAQPALTRRIHRLEQAIGAQLFRRTAAGMELTEPGGVLLEHAYRIMELSNRALETTENSASGSFGHLMVGYYDSAILHGIPKLFREFGQRYPDVTVGFDRVLKRTQVDLVLDKVMHVAFGRHYPDEPGIVCRTVLTEKLYIAVNSSHASQWGEPIRIADLRGRPLAMYPRDRPEFADEVVHMCLSAGFAPMIAVEALDVVSCLAHVGIGTAAAVVPESATKTRTDDVVFLPVVDASPVSLSCIYRAERWSPTLDLFIDFLDRRVDCAADATDSPVNARRNPGMAGR